MEQGHSLAHHVRSHQCTVGIIVLEERNERCGDRGNLLRRYVHQVYICRRNYREVGILTALNNLTDKCTIIVQRGITLSDDMLRLFLGSKIYDIVIIQIGNTILHLTIRCLDKAKLIDLCIDTQRRNQTDVRAFRALNRTETTVVCIVYVTYLEAGTLTRQTARTQGRETTLVGYLGQRVRLIHELRQRVGTEERIDNARDSLGVDQVSRREHLIVADVHALTNRTAHTGQTDRELVRQLLTNGTDTTVRQVIDIIDGSL